MYRTLFKRLVSTLLIVSFIGLASLEAFLFKTYGDNMKTPYQIYEGILCFAILLFGFLDMYLGGITAGGSSKN